MNRILATAMFLGLAALQARTEELTFPVDGITRDIRVGEVQSYTFSADAGDLVSGTLDLKGITVNATVFDSQGKKIRTQQDLGPGITPVGLLVAPLSTTYRLEIIATGKVNTGSYAMSLKKMTPSIRMAVQIAKPPETYTSPRIVRLKHDVQEGKPGVLEEFWADAVRGGGPIIEPIEGDDRNVLATFLWKEIYETHNALLVWRVTEDYMTRIAGTNVWYKTLSIRKGSRILYSISPNDRPEDRIILPDYRYFTAQPDPLNPRRYPDNIDPTDSYVASVLELAGAPDEKWFRDVPPRRGKIQEITVDSVLLNSKRVVQVYTPPGYEPGRGAYPLIVFLDGGAYLRDEFGAPTILDNLIGAGKLRPSIALFVDGNRPLSTTFADALSGEIVPWVRANFPVSRDAKEVVIGGWSAGGSGAAQIALGHPDVFGNVFSQSGAFRGHPRGSLEPNSISQAYLDAPLLPIRFYIDAGLYDNIPDLPTDELALDESNTQGNRHFRDVLRAKGYDVIYRETGGGHAPLHWRATLPEGLMALLPPK